jgi:hypothetical protein
MLNFLLAVAHPDLRTKQTFYVSTVDVRAYLGSHESNDRIRAIFRQLGSVIPDIAFVENGETRDTFGGLIFGSMPRGEGVIRYAFHPCLVPILYRPAIFARIKLAILGQFVSKYAPILYENLELYANRDSPVWDVEVDELRSRLGVGTKMKVFTEFRNYALTPALAEINDKADFNVAVEEVRAKRGAGRKVERLIFTVTVKPEREAEEAELRHKLKGAEGQPKPDASRHPDTLDMFDGRTDRERGGPPLLRGETIEQARALFDDWGQRRPDIHALEREWQEHEAQRTERVRDPDKAFLGWVRRWKENRPRTIRKTDWD